MDAGGLILAGIIVARLWPGVSAKTKVRAIPKDHYVYVVHVMDAQSAMDFSVEPSRATEFYTETIRLEHLRFETGDGLYMGYGPLSDQLVYWIP